MSPPTIRHRQFETGLAWFSLGVLLVYAPIESWGADLTSPGYIVDLIAMALLLFSAAVSLQVRPRTAIALLCGTWGWCACLAWRSYFTRVISRRRGLGIYPAETEWQDPVLGWVLVVALCAFVFSLVLAWHSTRFLRVSSDTSP